MPYTSEQLEIINAAVNKSAVVIASAGSGKTTVIKGRAARLVELGFKPERILTTTFTLKSCNDLKAKMSEVSDKIIVTNLHKLAYQICQTHGGNYKVIDSIQQKEVIRVVADAMGDQATGFGLREMQKAIGSFRAKMITPDSFGDVENFYKDLLVAYNQYCWDNMLLDFDSIIAKAVEILSGDEHARRFEQSKYDYVFVDEYQDINQAQETLLNLLKGPNTFCCVVGDDEQSIYGWRGASSTFFKTFADRNDADTFFLTKNFRSTGSIVEAARIAINSKKQLRSNDTPLVSKTRSVRKCLVDNDKQEGKRIAHEILALIEEGVPASQMAVLYRTHIQAKHIEEALLEYGIPYQVKGATSFWAHKEIQVALALISYASRPCFISFKTISKNFKGVGDVSINKAWANNQDNPFCDLGPEASKVFSSIEALRQCNSSQEIAKVIFDHTNYGELIGPEDGLNDRNERLLFLTGAIDRAYNPNTGLNCLLESLSLARETALDSSENTVQLMTMHSAKGLEFDVTFIAGVFNGVFPSSRERADIEDEERLLFVAMTRAKKLLYMIGREDRKCSFLDCIPSAYDARVPPYSQKLGEHPLFTTAELKGSRKELKSTLMVSRLHLNETAKSIILKLREKLGGSAVDALTLSDIEIGLIKLIIPNGFKVRGEAPKLVNLAQAFLRKQADQELSELLA